MWIYLFSTAWEHDKEESGEQSKDTKNVDPFWDSLWFIHSFVYILAYVELILKCLILYYLISNFKEKYRLRELFNLNYDDIKGNTLETQFPGENGTNNYANESFSYAEDFQNKY